MVKRATTVDPLLSKVMQFSMNGGPDVVDRKFATFKSKQNEVTVEQGCLL